MTRRIDRSPEANRARSEAAKKAAANRKLRRTPDGPEGSRRGSAMLDPGACTIPAILARIAARTVTP